MEQHSQFNVKSFSLKPYQDKFVFSDARYPFLVGSWGVGKDLCCIIRGMHLSSKHSNNLGMIARAEYTDLKDSTIKDFQDYTGIKVELCFVIWKN